MQDSAKEVEVFYDGLYGTIINEKKEETVIMVKKNKLVLIFYTNDSKDSFEKWKNICKGVRIVKKGGKRRNRESNYRFNASGSGYLNFTTFGEALVKSDWKNINCKMDMEVKHFDLTPNKKNQKIKKKIEMIKNINSLFGVSIRITISICTYKLPSDTIDTLKDIGLLTGNPEKKTIIEYPFFNSDFIV
jgi:hypothetical protein